MAEDCANQRVDAGAHSVLRGLPSVDCYLKHERTLQKRAKGTGAWFLVNETYHSWRESDTRLLCVIGIRRYTL